MKSLNEIVLDQIADGHGYDKMTAVPPTRDQQRAMAEKELNNMSHTDFLWLLSLALDDMFPEEKA